MWKTLNEPLVMFSQIWGVRFGNTHPDHFLTLAVLVRQFFCLVDSSNRRGDWTQMAWKGDAHLGQSKGLCQFHHIARGFSYILGLRPLENYSVLAYLGLFGVISLGCKPKCSRKKTLKALGSFWFAAPGRFEKLPHGLKKKPSFGCVRARPVAFLAGPEHCKPMLREETDTGKNHEDTYQVQGVVANQDCENINLQGPNRYPNRCPTDTQLISRHAKSLQLLKCTLCTTFVLKICDFPAGAAKLYFVYCTIIHLYSKVATLEPDVPKCTSNTTLVLNICDFRAGAA